MKFEQLYSSSSGNLHVVTAANGNRLMIECGVRWALLQKALDFNFSGIEAAFMSHEHQDHCKSAKEVRRAGIDLYASPGTLEAIGISGRRVNDVMNKTLVRLPSFDVLCFDTHHDAAEPLGFVVREKESNEFMLFATDTSHLSQQFKYPFKIIAIECSYDKDILQERVDTGDINEALAKRLLTSHMERRVTLDYLSKYCDLSRCEQIHLLHMSADNLGDKEAVRREIEERTFIETLTVYSQAKQEV